MGLGFCMIRRRVSWLVLMSRYVIFICLLLLLELEDANARCGCGHVDIEGEGGGAGEFLEWSILCSYLAGSGEVVPYEVS